MQLQKLTLKNKIYDAIIIGAGAAGLFCAGQLIKNGKSVLILEHSDKIGAKILISGGGRCNFINQKVTFENFVSNNPQFARSALSQYAPQDFIKLVETYNIPYYEKTLGQLFVNETGGAKKILQMLLDECDGANIKTNCEVLEIENNENYHISTSIGNFVGENLIIATGGKSIPKMGATGFAYKIAQQFGLEIIEPSPALVPLIFTGDKFDWMKELAGVSFDGRAKFGKTSFDEAILFTHKGLSGPAILQISNYLNSGDIFHIDFAPKHNLADFLIDAKAKQPNIKLSKILSEILPSRLAAHFGNEEIIAKAKDAQLRELAQNLHNFPLPVSGTEGFAKAEVTKGGISTNELNQKTMESKKESGLYFIGECVDITGWLGGYNFGWSWSSAFACAKAILNKNTNITV